MKRLRVALIVKNSPVTCERERRNMGWWSYPVSEFEWVHFIPGNGEFDLAGLPGFDLIFHEDGGNWCSYVRRPGSPPVVYLSVDSTLSDRHYQERLEQAAKADLVLVDHDRLERFLPTGLPVRRLAYCVNDRLFRPRGEKSVDVSFHCGIGERWNAPGSKERAAIRDYLTSVCAQTGWSYRAGGLEVSDYARALACSRIVVNWPRTAINRPHRIFDAMASGACVLTGRLPEVEEDHRVPGVDYLEFDEMGELPGLIERLLENGAWERVAASGHKLVIERHTWAVRAKELRELLARELGL